MPGIVDWLRVHRVACFLVMTVSFLIFGWLSLDLIKIIGANLHFVSDNGVQGLREGGLAQMLELLLTSIGAMAAYLLFKLCETLLLQTLAGKH